MSGRLTLKLVRQRAVQATLFPPTTLGRAMTTLGFVQADPIRAPARAQDLILRHRVAGYRAGDLERHFARLRLAEDFLYAYGFMPGDTARLLHPRRDPRRADGRHVPTGLAAKVLEFVRTQDEVHPRDLEIQFGKKRAVNGWGGFSKATTRALHSLHHHGLLRVARRRDGIRIYEAAPPPPEPLPTEERLQRLVRLVMRLLAPAPETSLRAAFSLLRSRSPGLGNVRATIAALIASGEIERGEVDGETYLWLAGGGAPEEHETPREVRFLAPFDPVVWDRRRFEHLWGWPYRFEAYTPPAKRRLGYYAMPLLWGDKVIGWVNAATAETGVQIEPGFVAARPKGRDFARAFDAEVARLGEFLGGSRTDIDSANQD
jgi:uncharacterized protein YcaQ